ncbi:hypothetical protein [Bacillus sp. EB01]|uniref:hypothetical protein n=1 Tax=Bacillus sp. EB01 TaxID=1347086 RepID=UPI0005C59024|nr:hypothetical protein [Bacillus sp. EB01]
MKLAIFISILNVLLIYTFAVKRRLHILEMMVIWMIVWLITHSISSILTVNVERLAISRNVQEFSIHFLKRFLLYPLVIIHFIDFSLRFKSIAAKIAIALVNVFVMTLLVYLFIEIGVLYSKGYKWGYSILEWIFTIGLTIGVWYLYRKKYMRGL